MSNIISYFGQVEMDRLTAAQVFVDIAHSGSFTATAERLSMSRSMVTRYVEAMEQWFDARLLHRTTRKVNLTTLGEQCLVEIEPWLEQAQQFVVDIKPASELSDSIRISTSMSFAHAQLITAFNEFMQCHPKVTIDIDLGDNTVDLVKNRIDLAIRIASNPEPSLIGKPIAKCRSVLVASPDYLAQHPVISTPQDLSQHQCLGYTNFGTPVWHFQHGEQHIATEVSCRLTANEATVLLEAAKNGAGIAIQPTYMANKLIKSGELIAVLPQWKINNMKIYALYSSRKHLSPTVRALIDFLSQYFEQHPWDIDHIQAISKR